MAQWLSFEQALDGSKAMARNLLLGNGFSVSASQSFMYRSLFSETDFSNIQVAQKLFGDFNTYDFEKIIRYLDISSRVSSLVGNDTFSSELFSLKTTLIDRFVKTIVRIHPTNLHEETGRVVIANSNFSRNNNFLKNFIRQRDENIFTMNYDLLLYWSILEGLENGILNVVDGFSYNGYWSEYYVSNIFYIHGALHLRTNDYGDTYKLRYDDAGLLSQAANDLMNNVYPLIVFEGSSEDKEKRIKNNKYLSMCHKKLSSIYGILFTYGVSFSANDIHIVNAILNSQITDVCIGVYLDPEKWVRKTGPVAKVDI